MVAELSVSGAALTRLVRRGLEAVPGNLEQLQFNAGAYERAGPEMEVKPEQMLPVLVTGLVFILLIASVRYTIGDVMVSLAMIESPSSTTIIEPKPPVYSEHPDAITEKEPLTSKLDLEADVEVTVIKHKPITSKIIATMAHLQRTGGFFSRWRGIGWSFVYHGAHSLLTHAFAIAFGFSWLSNALFFVISSMLLARLHMTWTHRMISQASTTSVHQQLVPAHYNLRVLALPTLVFAVAQQATFLVPMAIASGLGLFDRLASQQGHGCATVTTVKALGFLAVLVTGPLIALTVLLPAAITLTRIEASVLPEGRQTIVPFDRDAIVGELDLTTRAGRKAFFKQTWRSVDCAARWHIIKLYLKMALVQFTLLIVGLHLLSLEVFVIGGEKVGTLVKSAHAQIQLAMMKGQEHGN